MGGRDGPVNMGGGLEQSIWEEGLDQSIWEEGLDHAVNLGEGLDQSA